MPGPRKVRHLYFAQLSFDERFGLIVDAEYLARHNRKLQRRLTEAKFRYPSGCVEDIDATAQRNLDKALLRQLASCQWVAEHLHVIITGPTGTGKTYVACALAHKACRTGYRTLYRRLPRLLTELKLAHADGSFPKVLSRLARFDLLVIDDWGTAPLTDPQRRDLFEIIEDRDGTCSTLLASQLPQDAWHDYIGDPTIADALLDRIVHQAYKIDLQGPSRRKLRRKP